jgi:hypothetical protein
VAPEVNHLGSSAWVRGRVEAPNAQADSFIGEILSLERARLVVNILPSSFLPAGRLNVGRAWPQF